MRTSLVVSAAVFLLACQPPVTQQPDPVNPVTDAGVDAGVQCPDQTHEADGGCVSAIAWASAATGPVARDHHGTFMKFTDTPTLIVFGGVDMALGEARHDTWITNPSTDGFVSAWRQGPRALFWQAGMGVDGTGDRFYSVSGMSVDSGGHSALTPRVQSLSINADGTPGTWREEKPLPGVGRFHVTVTRVGEWLFAMGGRTDDGVAKKEIWKAHIGADGVLSDWTEERAFPLPRTHHASFAFGNRLYLSGGFDAVDFTSNPTHHRNILTATVDPATGALSEWSTLPLPWDLSTHSAGVMDGYVYLVGGFDGSLNLLGLVRRAKLNEDGTLGEFEEMTALPHARAHVHHTPMFGGRIYSVGGNVGDHFTTDEVMIGFLY
ncbi:MAG: hypothetical protein QM817_00225 [Archangium sp.]